MKNAETENAVDHGTNIIRRRAHLCPRFLSCIRFVAPLIATIVLVGCWPSSDNPLDDPSSSRVDPSPYLGQWKLIWWAGEQSTNSPFRIKILVDSQQKTQLVVTAESDSFTNNIQLTSVGSLTIASVSKNQAWDIFSVAVVSNGQQITVGSLSDLVVSNHIASGVVSGRVLNVDSRNSFIKLEATGQQLRSYISNNPSVFQPFYIFQKD